MIVVFLGSSLAVAEARGIVDAVYLAPAVQGSVVLAVERFRPSAILLIDGGFQSEPAVRHKELLWALSLGIGVSGAASMGALRAAELCHHGMEGTGLIYRWYRRHRFAPDDAVAVLHGPPELNGMALTRSLIDLRMTFRAAQRQGLIDPPLRQRLELAAAQLHFADRIIAQVIGRALPPRTESGREANQRLAGILENAFLSQKAADARQALHLLRTPRPPSPPKEFTLTRAFVRDLEDAGIDPGILVRCAAPKSLS
jgi:hypothetical protein